MITTSTGAKKLESSDNWREIFPNPGTSAAGAHNASVDAQDRIQAEVAPIINGKQCAVGAAEGEYVLLRNSTITGKTDGAYKAAKAIPANTNIDSTYLGSPITGGISNDINSKIAELSESKTGLVGINAEGHGSYNSVESVAYVFSQLPNSMHAIAIIRFASNSYGVAMVNRLNVNYGTYFMIMDDPLNPILCVRQGVNYQVKTISMT